MPLTTFVAVMIGIGVLLWVVNKFVPMEANIKSILNAVVIIATVLWILALFLPGLGSIRIGK